MVPIDLLYWPPCPSHAAALAKLQRLVREVGLDPAHIRQHEVITMEDAVRLAFVGSPTIRIGGHDVVETADPPGLLCRVYRRQDGRISAMPDERDIRMALRKAFPQDEPACDSSIST